MGLHQRGSSLHTDGVMLLPARAEVSHETIS
jgi:hypothetical protein